MNDSRKLLADYAERGSEAAFRELVDRYINMVYSTALRLVNGDAHTAQDIAQTVFLNLAHKAGMLSGEVMIGGWLHRNTCFVAATMIRSNRRREERERKAVEMNTTEDHSAAHFAMTAPLLDEAINELSQEDRTAILLRFFEQLEFRAVAAAMGASEDAARMRVNRALDKLHAMLSKRGVTVSVAALGTALAVETVNAAPIGLAASVATTALSGGVAGGTSLTIAKILSMSALKTAVAGTVVVGLIAVPMIMQQQSNKALRAEIAALKQQVALRSPTHEELRPAPESSEKDAIYNQPSESQVRELARLRNQVALLRDQTNELGKLRRTVEDLKETAREEKAPTVSGGQGVLSGIPADETQRTDMCVKNLRALDSAKQQWALEQRKQVSDTPAMRDLVPYLAGYGGGFVVPVCPDGDAYTIGTVGEKPTCTNPKHILP